MTIFCNQISCDRKLFVWCGPQSKSGGAGKIESCARSRASQAKIRRQWAIFRISKDAQLPLACFGMGGCQHSFHNDELIGEDWMFALSHGFEKGINAFTIIACSNTPKTTFNSKHLPPGPLLQSPYLIELPTC